MTAFTFTSTYFFVKVFFHPAFVRGALVLGVLPTLKDLTGSQIRELSITPRCLQDLRGLGHVGLDDER